VLQWIRRDIPGYCTQQKFKIQFYHFYFNTIRWTFSIFAPIDRDFFLNISTYQNMIFEKNVDVSIIALMRLLGSLIARNEINYKN